MISSPSSNSPDGSFRLPNRRSQLQHHESNETSSSASSTDGRVGTPPTRGKPSMMKVSSRSSSSNNNKNNSNKSHDSGFSDSTASDREREERATSSQSKPESTSEDSEEPHCEVVHETRTSSFDTSKQYHVSKVYFYSVSDVLQQTEDTSESREHVSILDCQTGRVRRGYAQPPERSASPMLSPPLSPPPSMLRSMINTSTEDSDNDCYPTLDPLACDINYFDSLLEHKPLPCLNSTQTPSPGSAVGGLKVHTGTSSLGRKTKRRPESPGGHLTSPPAASPCGSCKSPTQFPKTNGSLYESLSLGRRCHCDKRSRSTRPSTGSSGDELSFSGPSQASPSVSLPSPAWTGTAYDSFDDPLSGSRRSFRSVSELSVSSGPTSPWQTSTSEMSKTEYHQTNSSSDFTR